MSESIASPILNSPYDAPTRYFEIGPNGPTGDTRPGRRPSESYIPIAPSRKGKEQLAAAFDFDITGERREKNSLINDLRRELERWRRSNYHRATPISRRLLKYWSDETRGEERVLYCQREAAETAIFLVEVAGRHGYTDWRRRLEPENDTHNAGLPRVALKMATGSGKTVVMAMLIAWQTLNKEFHPHDARFANRFLVVTPGITIRDRLRVLLPSDPDNYYKQRHLLPPDLEGAINRAVVVITNYHSFLLKDAKEIKGVAANTRKLLLAGKDDDPFREAPKAMVARVLRDLGATGDRKRPIVVFNDEAHHCYMDRPVEAVGGQADRLSKEQRDANEDARVWFRGLQAIDRYVGIKSLFDLSATPFYLSGSGYAEGHIFPWTVSDFTLMDAIESGIVKIPRMPVDDDAEGPLVTYLRLWEFVGDRLPRRKAAAVAGTETWIPPAELQGALQSLFRSYRRSFDHWQTVLAPHGETPPVFIVVCPNTLVSKLVYEWIAGSEVEAPDGTTYDRPGHLDLFSNVIDGRMLSKPRTILVDSAQLESGDALKTEFKTAAATEIEAFKAEYRLRHRGADLDQLTDEDLLREVMNTVGKKGKLGEGVRCVVSVAMLTEGWDANTVTHILGIRAFRSQLLCEQVMGRGLRRRSYALNEQGRFEPEYANVYGIPFAFIPSDATPPEVLPRPPAQEVRSLEGREHLRITFPRLDGYRVELPDEDLFLDLEAENPFDIGPSTVPNWVEAAPVVGETEEDTTDWSTHRPQQIAYALAKRLLDAHFVWTEEDRRPWLFPGLVRICRTWLHSSVRAAEGFSVGHLMIAEFQNVAVEAIFAAIVRQDGNRRARLRPMIRRADSVGSTEGVYFLTRKPVVSTEKSQVSHVVLDGRGGNTWEQLLASYCELNRDVAAYVKNDHLGFTIPYVHKGQSHSYVPDFLVRLRRPTGESHDRTLIIEVSGGQKGPGATKAKAETARDSWCVAVNNHGGFGRWGYVEFTSMDGVKERLADAIENLYDDSPIIGDPDLLDFTVTSRGGTRGA